jgi:hypothetical protein
MENIVFVNAANQSIASASMDVPRTGEQVIVANQLYSVAGVRYFLYPGNVIRTAVLLAPSAPNAATSELYHQLSKVE